MSDSDQPVSSGTTNEGQKSVQQPDKVGFDVMIGDDAGDTETAAVVVAPPEEGSPSNSGPVKVGYPVEVREV